MDPEAAAGAGLRPGKYRFKATIVVLRAMQAATKKRAPSQISLTCKSMHKLIAQLQPNFFQFTHNLDTDAGSLVNGQKFPSRPVAGEGSFAFGSLTANPEADNQQMKLNASRDQDGILTLRLPFCRVKVADDSCRWAFTATFPRGWENSTTKDPMTAEIVMHVKPSESNVPQLEHAPDAAAAAVGGALVPQKRATAAGSTIIMNKASTINLHLDHVQSMMCLRLSWPLTADGVAYS
jgi:hypothetical protein